jgi:hypothetical protein
MELRRKYSIEILKRHKRYKYFFEGNINSLDKFFWKREKIITKELFW